MIKRVVMKDSRYFATYIHFMKYIAENGKAVCAIDGEIVEPSAGNDVYRKLKAKGATCISREVLDKSNTEIVEYIESGIDRFADYIDNYRQYDEACRRNYKLKKLVSEFRRVAEI